MNKHTKRDTFLRETTPLINGLYAAAVRLAGSRAEADDIVQEAMLHAWPVSYTHLTLPTSDLV